MILGYVASFLGPKFSHLLNSMVELLKGLKEKLSQVDAYCSKWSKSAVIVPFDSFSFAS